MINALNGLSSEQIARIETPSFTPCRYKWSELSAFARVIPTFEPEFAEQFLSIFNNIELEFIFKIKAGGDLLDTYDKHHVNIARVSRIVLRDSVKNQHV